MKRYLEISKELKQALDKKTNWGRNELYSLIDEICLKVADEEIEDTANQHAVKGFTPPWEQ